MQIWEGQNSDPGSGVENVGYGIRDKHSGSATLFTVIVYHSGWAETSAKILAVLPWLSFPRCLVIAALFKDFLSWLSCHGCPVMVFLS